MSRYERELKGILAGDEEKIEKATKTVRDEIKEIYRRTIDRPFLLIRGAGSLGIDLVAMRGTKYFPIEVKSANKKTIYFSDHGNDEQFEEFSKACREAKAPLLYAFRLKGIRGEKWRLFRTSNNRFDISISPLQYTRNGKRKLEFYEGSRLSDFISQILD